MFGKDTYYRLRKYGGARLILSFDFLFPAIVVLTLSYFKGSRLSDDLMTSVMSFGGKVSITLLATIIGGIALLSTISSSEFRQYIQQREIYDRLHFIFEYCFILALLTAVIGEGAQLIYFEPDAFYLYLFLFSHLLISAIRLPSILITFGKKKAHFDSIINLDEERVEDIEIPEELMAGYEEKTVEEIEKEEQDTENTSSEKKPELEEH